MTSRADGADVGTVSEYAETLVLVAELYPSENLCATVKEFARVQKKVDSISALAAMQKALGDRELIEPKLFGKDSPLETVREERRTAKSTPIQQQVLVPGLCLLLLFSSLAVTPVEYFDNTPALLTTTALAVYHGPVRSVVVPEASASSTALVVYGSSHEATVAVPDYVWFVPVVVPVTNFSYEDPLPVTRREILFWDNPLLSLSELAFAGEIGWARK